MPSVRTKAVGTRIPKDLYWVLLRQAAERKMTMSLYLQELLSKIVDVEQKVEQKENGGNINGVTTIRFIAFNKEPNLFVRKIDNKWQMFKVITKGDAIVQMSDGVIGHHTEAVGYKGYNTRFSGYDIFLNHRGEWCKGSVLTLNPEVLNTKEVDLKIVK